MKYNFECPICKEFLFTAPLSDEINDVERCLICGWIVNEEEMNNPSKLNRYKKIFKNHRKGKSNWTWMDENAPELKPHKCPVCGKYEFPDDASYDICPYCGWEDDGVQLDDPNYSGGANILSLNKYKEQYKQIIKENPKYKWKKDYKKI